MTATPDVRLPPGLAEDIDAYADEVARFRAGELSAAALRARRVPRGVYEQRQDGTYMVRVRVAGGTLSAEQARTLAAAGRTFGNGLLHVTTRQDVQIHDVAIEDTPRVMRRLLPAGLTSRGGGGNTVRNVTACPYAGVCPAERFDVTPSAHAVTAYLIAQTGSFHLPRKYKIAFSGCAADCALAQVADLGFVAHAHNGVPGFRVFAGGGMGAQSRVADVLLDGSPAADAVRVAETVRRLFDRHGDREDKHRARLRFVFERMGVDGFRRAFADEAHAVAEDGVPDGPDRMPLHREAGAPEPPAPSRREGMRLLAQRQPGVAIALLHLPMGFLPSQDFERLGELAARFSGEAGLRTTRAQNLVIRSVHEADLTALADALRGLETDLLSPVPLERFVACAGASTCRLGIGLARNAARACADAWTAGGIAPDVQDALEVHINGCPNACGHQPVGAIGCFGIARRREGRLLPAYTVTVGGRCHAGGARFGTPVGKVPAAALPALLRDVAADFAAHRDGAEPFLAYADRRGPAYFETLATRHAAIPDYAERPDVYRDLDADEAFTLAGRGAGECGAGVFDLIREELAAARRATDPFEILLSTTRALLVVRGIDARDPDTVLRAFERHFVDTGLVPETFRPLLARARDQAAGDRQSSLDGPGAAVADLRDRVEGLYATLDANLAFHPAGKQAPVAPAETSGPSGGGAELDLRGVACPINFVKARLKLETMRTGETLVLVLDDGEPVRNVPASFEGEGQDVVERTDLGDGHWRIAVRKRT